MLIDKSAMLLLIVILFTSINSIFSAIYTCDPRNSCGCSAVSTTVTARIVGGEAAENYAWNWMISFQLLGEHRCGASLLTPEYAVTAAHCVNGIMGNLSILSILTGTNYLDDTTSPSIQRRAITKIAMNPYYVASSEINDIAILQFAPLNTSSDYEIAFICLPQQDQDPFQTNSNLVVIGWGVTSESSETVSNYLQQVTVQAFSPTSTDCEQSGIVNTTVQFCAGIEGGGKDACQGDSGGPIMSFVNNTWVLAGLVSEGMGCAQPGYPGIYTRVSRFIWYINAILNGTVVTTPVTIAPTTTTTIKSNHTQQNNGNVMGKSISMIIFYLSFLVFR